MLILDGTHISWDHTYIIIVTGAGASKLSEEAGLPRRVQFSFHLDP